VVIFYKSRITQNLGAFPTCSVIINILQQYETVALHTTKISYSTRFSYKMVIENSNFRIFDIVRKFPDTTNPLKNHDMKISTKTTFSSQEFLPDMFPSLLQVCITWPIHVQLMIYIISRKSFARKET